MDKDTDFIPSNQLDLERIKVIVLSYRLPIIFGFLGISLFIAAIILLSKSHKSSSEVVFQTEASPSAKSKIRVDVAGAVLNPNVYELEEGSRISDALVAAGGLSGDADRDWVQKNINRAAKLIDGGKIFIPSLTDVSFGKSEIRNLPAQTGPKSEIDLSDLNTSSNLLGVTIGKTNINSASQLELEALPGVGPVTAGKIMSGRPYQTIEELKTKKIVGNALFEKIKDLLSI